VKHIRKCLMLAVVLLIYVSCASEEIPVVLVTDAPVLLGLPALPTPPPTPEPTPEPTPAPTPVPTPRPPRDKLSGEFTTYELVNMRPVAVSISNMQAALPQSGIGEASIIYETLAEGSITRLVAVFSPGFSAEKIGPVRSARAFFLRYAQDHDAIFAHHGGSSSVVGSNGAYEDIRNFGLITIDAMRDRHSTFWRDPVRRSTGRLEHSSYTGAEHIMREAESRDMIRERNFEGAFGFFEEHTSPIGKKALTVKPKFSSQLQAFFEYDEQTGLYRRYAFGRPQIDELTGEQLAVSNIIIQFTDVWILPGDPMGRREVRLTGEGNGYLITGGTITPITWSKEDFHTPTVWTRHGSQLKLNVGSTWICVLDSSTQIVLNEENY